MSFLCARPGKCLAGRWFVLAILVCLLASSAGCGGFFQSENAIASVTIKPRSVIAGMDESISFTAMARTNGGDEFDVTDSATWTSSSDAARIDGPGRVTTTAQGSVTVSATKDTVKGESSVLVAEYRLQSIDVTPVDQSISVNGGGVQYKANGVFADGSTQDITSIVTWSSSDSSVATVTSNGLATPVASGETTITAAVSTASALVSNSTHLTVD